MKHILVAVGLGLASVAAFSQGVAPLSGNALLITETTRKVSIGWSENAWSDFEPSELRWSRAADGVEVLTGSRGGVLVDPKTYLHYQVASGVSQLTETVSQSSSREGKALESGTSWKAERSYQSPSVSWCDHTTSKLDSNFKVGPKEKYTLKIDGKEATIDVIPVVEQGWWTRCYSGKRYTRFLVSTDLGAVVSIEHIGYTPQGQAHDSSYRFNVKEIRRL